jgi:hypothetical protein
MSNPASPISLPETWAKILERIDARLEEAIAAADERAATLPSPGEESPTADRRAELAELAARLGAVSERATRAQALAADVDLALAVSEDGLHFRLAETEALSKRLAAWAVRAIG